MICGATRPGIEVQTIIALIRRKAERSEQITRGRSGLAGSIVRLKLTFKKFSTKAIGIESYSPRAVFFFLLPKV
jgi:hypothetical protein